MVKQMIFNVIDGIEMQAYTRMAMFTLHSPPKRRAMDGFSPMNMRGMV